MIISGRNSVREAVNADINIRAIYIQNDVKGAENQELIEIIKAKGYRYQFMPKAVMDKKWERHQGFACEVEDYKYYELDEIIEAGYKTGEQLFLLILDGIEDPHNLGSIIRSAECVGVHGIILEKRNACEVNATVTRVSAGAVNHMKIARVTNINTTINDLKQKGVWVYACEIGGENIFSSNLKGDIALVIGSEGKGVSRLTKSKCDGIVTLPMKGKVNSLNASNACAVALYEILRQRG